VRQRDDGRNGHDGDRGDRGARDGSRRRAASINNVDLHWERLVASSGAGLGNAGGLGGIGALPLVDAAAADAPDASAKSDAGRGRTLVSLGPHPPGSAHGRSLTQSQGLAGAARSPLGLRRPPPLDSPLHRQSCRHRRSLQRHPRPLPPRSMSRA
jgi:hypothetical protein